MSLNVENFAAANKAAVESLLSVANTALNAAERVAALNIETARVTLGDSSAAAKSLLGAKDAQSAIAVQQSLVQPAIEKSVAYSKSLYDIANEAKNEVSKLFEAQVAEFQKSSSDLLNQALKNAPAGSESIVKAMQDAVEKANAAFGTATAMTQQFVESAQATAAAVVKKGK